MSRAARIVHVGLLMVLAAASASAQDEVLVRGVPFVGWRETAETRPQSWDEANPSIDAAERMVLGYWRDGVTAQAYYAERTDALPYTTRVEQPTLADLRAALAAGSPVIVSLPLTPIAHPASLMWILSARLMADDSLPIAGGPSTHAFWPLVPVEALVDLPVKLKAEELRRQGGELYRVFTVADPLVAADRVVVGLDEARGIVLLHDPSFGPAFEMPLRDFERGWRLAPWMQVMRPPGADSVVVQRAAAPPYRQRTPDERAAWLFVLGYAQGALNRLPEADRNLHEALAVPGIGDGYRYMIAWELGPVLCSLGRVDEAVEMVELATRLLPELPSPWAFLKEHYPMSTRAERQQLAKEAGKRGKQAEKQLKDPLVRQRIDAFVPADFHVVLGERGWAPRPARAAVAAGEHQPH